MKAASVTTFLVFLPARALRHYDVQRHQVAVQGDKRRALLCWSIVLFTSPTKSGVQGSFCR